MGFLAKAVAPRPSSTNQNNKLVTGIYTPQAQAGVGATNYLSSLLTGQGDVGAADAGFENYLKNAGYENALSRMVRGVTGGQAAAGLLRSGSTSNALLQKGTELNQGMFDNYLQSLSGLSELGLGGGKLLTDAGAGEAKSMRQSGTGLGLGIAGKIFGGLFSDRRLKEDIKEVGFYENGLPMYEFRYKGQSAKWRGVMADDVEKAHPEAVGETLDGYKTVDYGRIGIRMERA